VVHTSISHGYRTCTLAGVLVHSPSYRWVSSEDRIGDRGHHQHARIDIERMQARVSSLAQETKRVPSTRTGTAVQRYSSRSAGYLPLLPPLTMADRWMRDYNDAMYAPPHPPRPSCPSVPAVSFVTPSRVALRHWGHGLSCDS
jgi:hypothetical protein